MPNWCSTAYAIEGDAKEVKKLYGLMMGLQKRKEPSVKNGFGTTWVGCLVDALGGDYNEICCRGDWNSLERVGNVLKLETETAWGPCNETFELVCQKFPTLSYYYQSEEPGMAGYWTNDVEGKYFPDKYIADLRMPLSVPALYHYLPILICASKSCVALRNGCPRWVSLYSLLTQSPIDVRITMIMRLRFL